MPADLTVLRGGFGLSVQDLGRAGFLSSGLARGGAMDRLALYEGAALLGQQPDCAALEMTAAGGVFQASEDLRIALTGAPMRALIDGAALVWNASHLLPKGAMLTITGAGTGVYGYLHVAGGINTALALRSRSAHFIAGIGEGIETGAVLPCGPDQRSSFVGYKLTVEPRFSGGEVRVIPTPQTALFSHEEQARFSALALTRDRRGNRMGVRFLSDGQGFAQSSGLSILSQTVVPGDIQIAGDGMPFVLLSECQTTGGYPRIGTVLPCDIPRVAQTPPSVRVRFRFVHFEEGLAVEKKAHALWHGLSNLVTPLVRDPHDIADLLSYQLISGVTAGNDL